MPTGLALAPDGPYYVGQLTGAPFADGVANVYRAPPEGGVPEVVASRFTNIIDVRVRPDGSLYVLQIAIPPPNIADGELFRITPDETRTDRRAVHRPRRLGIAKEGTIS